jgi:hypothetical protein
LLITLDVREKNYDEVIMEKVIPIMQKEKANFVIDKNVDSQRYNIASMNGPSWVSRMNYLSICLEPGIKSDEQTNSIQN